MAQVETSTARAGIRRTATALGATVVLIAAGAAHAGARITSIDGVASQGDTRLSMHDEVAAGELVETIGDGRCSVLLAEEVVIQACNQAALRLHKDEARGPRVVELTSGELKASVGPRPDRDPIEIHTPAAIATILGTTLLVRVKQETGETTITSLHNVVRVESSDPGIPGSVTLRPGEEVIVRRGKPPSRKRLIRVSSLRRTSDCLDDEGYRRAAVAVDRAEREAEVMDLVTSLDVPEVLPAVSAGGPAAGGSGAAGGGDAFDLIADAKDPATGLGGITNGDSGGVCLSSDVCGGFDIEKIVDPSTRSRRPDPCAGTPGDHCSF